MIVERIAARLALPTSYLLKLASTASHRYKRYEIPKKTGGMREIFHPARELKLVQRWLLRNVLLRLPVHAAATAYQPRSTIRRNAEIHADNNFILRIDFQDFFPSIRGGDVERILNTNRQHLAEEEVSDLDIWFIKQIVCRLDHLTVGAPTSPVLSNAIMFEFDSMWSQNATTAGVAYTRYADDLYFSTNQPNVLSDLKQRVELYLKEGRRPLLRINEAKTAISSRRWRRLATGLVLTSDRKISLGRHKKRMLKALVWKLKQGELPAAEIASLRGWISYARSIEPDFVVALTEKYGLDLAARATWEI